MASSLLLAPAHAEIAVKSGDRIAFFGDSITEAGWSSPVGYVRLVIAGLAANGVHAEAIAAGVGGNKSNHLRERVQHDVIDKKPQWMTLSCGINDVSTNIFGVPLDDAQAAAHKYQLDPGEPAKGTFQKNITTILDQVTAAKIKPVILTATVIHEDLNNSENALLRQYNEFLRRLAAQRHLPLADVNAYFVQRINAENKPGQKVLTHDGIHMNAEGDKLMALVLLRAFGLDNQQLRRAQDAWTRMR